MKTWVIKEGTKYVGYEDDKLDYYADHRLSEAALFPTKAAAKLMSVSAKEKIVKVEIKEAK